MDKEAYARLLAEQAKERAELEQRIAQECADKARALARQKADAPGARPSWAPKPTDTEFYGRELAEQKRQRAPELAQLDARHQAIRRDIEKDQPNLAHDRLATKAPVLDERKVTTFELQPSHSPKL